MVERKIIGLTGKGGSGKDTVADYLEEKYNFKKISFGELLYKIAYLLGMKEKDRQFLIDLGDALRGMDQDVFIRPVVEEILSNTSINYVITDVRQPNEYKALLDLGAEIFEVYAPLNVRLNRIEKRDKIILNDKEIETLQKAHTETYMENWNLDKIVNDKDTKTLYANIDKALKK